MCIFQILYKIKFRLYLSNFREFRFARALLRVIRKMEDKKGTPPPSPPTQPPYLPVTPPGPPPPGPPGPPSSPSLEANDELWNEALGHGDVANIPLPGEVGEGDFLYFLEG